MQKSSTAINYFAMKERCEGEIEDERKRRREE
jgi:hypothetical protein